MTHKPQPDRSAEHASDLPEETLDQYLDALLQGPPPALHIADSNEAARPILCPTPGEWLLLAMRQAGFDAVDAAMAHAAACHHCAALLRQSLRLLTIEASPEETAEIGNLTSASRGWRRKMAAELARTPRQAARLQTGGVSPKPRKFRRET